MTVYQLKSIIAVAFLVSALSAGLAMLALMGRAESRTRPEKLRRFHRLAGYLFALLLLVLGALGTSLLVRAGDTLSSRAVFHAFIGQFLLSIFFLKWLIARFFRQFLRMMPALGMAVFVLSLVAFSMALHFFLRAAASEALPGEIVRPAADSSVERSSPPVKGSFERGADLFNRLCSSCHHPDRKESKLGPGLKDLFKDPSLPHSGKAATEENIRQQLLRPALSMPVFARLTDQELADLMAYLKKL